MLRLLSMIRYSNALSFIAFIYFQQILCSIEISLCIILISAVALISRLWATTVLTPILSRVFGAYQMFCCINEQSLYPTFFFRYPFPYWIKIWELIVRFKNIHSQNHPKISWVARENFYNMAPWLKKDSLKKNESEDDCEYD